MATRLRSIRSFFFRALSNLKIPNGKSGPLGFTDLDREGMLIEGFEELGTFVTFYNYPYYQNHIEKAGYQKSTDWVEYEISVPDEFPKKLERISSLISKKFKIRQLKVNKKKLKPRAKEFFDLLNEAYQDLYGFVKLTDGQIKDYADQYMNFLSDDYTSVLVNEKDEFVGFGVSIPSLSKALQKSKGRLFPLGIFRLLRALKKNDRIDLSLVAIKPAYQGLGIHLMIFEKIFKSFVESNPELEDNHKVQALWKGYDLRQHKRRRCYIKYL